MPSALSLKAIEFAKIELDNHVRESDPPPANWGKDVQKYIKSLGHNAPMNWCMAFQYWCSSQASATLGITTPLRKTANCWQQWLECRDYQVVLRNDDQSPINAGVFPQVGDLMIIKHILNQNCSGENKLLLLENDETVFDLEVDKDVVVFGHTGIVTEILDDGFKTIEGNTSSNYDKNSIYVSEKKHKLDECRRMLEVLKDEQGKNKRDDKGHLLSKEIGKKVIIGFLRF